MSRFQEWMGSSDVSASFDCSDPVTPILMAAEEHDQLLLPQTINSHISPVEP